MSHPKESATRKYPWSLKERRTWLPVMVTFQKALRSRNLMVKSHFLHIGHQFLRFLGCVFLIFDH